MFILKYCTLQLLPHDKVTTEMASRLQRKYLALMDALQKYVHMYVGTRVCKGLHMWVMHTYVCICTVHVYVPTPLR